MTDQWEIQATQFGNCNCAFGCPCQFNAPTSHGFYQVVVSNLIRKGHFNGTPLDDLDFLILLHWPGEIAEGNGRQQVIIDERANTEQRHGKKIAHGKATLPGTNIFYVYNSSMSEVLDTLYAPMEIDIDVDARKAQITCSNLVKSAGSPLINPFSGEESRAGIHLPGGLEYTYAEMGVGNSSATGKIALELSESYGQFSHILWNQDGVIHKTLAMS